MPISSPWARWEPAKPPSVVGVYELAHVTFGVPRIVYIGSGSINRRIRDHGRDTAKVFSRYRVVTTRDRRRARQIERREQRRYRDQHGSLPAFNSQIG